MAHFRHRDNGRVQIIITHGKRFDGKPQRYTKEVDYVSKKQLEIEASLFLADIINDSVTAPTGCTINTLFDDFMSNHKDEIGMKTSTAERYVRIYENQIKPFLGQRSIKDISKTDLRNWVRYLSSEYRNKRTGKPIAQKTVKNALALLSAMYTYAVYDLEIIDKNPCLKIRVPKANVASRPEAHHYNESDVALLIMHLMDELKHPKSITHATLVMLILFTGMRTGEVMGLKWSDINFETNTLKIERERIYVSAMGIIEDTPKTESSRRTISFPVTIMDMLKALKAHQNDCRTKMGDEYTDTDYVAISLTGKPLHPRGTYKWFRNFIERYNMKPVTIHDLRHTHVAMLSSIGVKIIDVSKRLGHSNTRVTQEVYEYLYKDIDNDISQKLNQLIDTIQQNIKMLS